MGVGGRTSASASRPGRRAPSQSRRPPDRRSSREPRVAGGAPPRLSDSSVAADSEGIQWSADLPSGGRRLVPKGATRLEAETINSDLARRPELKQSDWTLFAHEGHRSLESSVANDRVPNGDWTSGPGRSDRQASKCAQLSD